MESSSSRIVIVSNFPHVKIMWGIVKDKGMTRQDFVDWFGLKIDEMLLLPYREKKEKELQTLMMDNYLREYERFIFHWATVNLEGIRSMEIDRIELINDSKAVIVIVNNGEL